MSYCISQFSVSAQFSLNDLASRTLADELFESIIIRSCPTVEVDFTGIDTISRAFADQFHKLKLEACANGKKVEVVGMNDSIHSMFKSVCNTQGNFNRQYKTAPVFNIATRKELKDFLFAF